MPSVIMNITALGASPFSPDPGSVIIALMLSMASLVPLSWSLKPTSVLLHAEVGQPLL